MQKCSRYLKIKKENNARSRKRNGTKLNYPIPKAQESLWKKHQRDCKNHMARKIALKSYLLDMTEQLHT